MGDKSGIEWTDATWNPTTGCDQVSPGCDNCYALTMAQRLKAMGSPAYQQDGDPRTSGPGFAIQWHEDRLDQPLRWTKPRRIFVNSMSDLFHPRVPSEFIDRVFAVMAATPRHTYQVLTKRPKRMRSYLVGDGITRRPWIADLVGSEPPWPLPNVWLGTSVEDQQRADERIPPLLDTPAAVRFLSCEPLLGPVDIVNTPGGHPDEGLGWVIVGGESGRGARPMHPAWARSLRDQCLAFGVPFLFKQWGAWVEGGDGATHGRWVDPRTAATHAIEDPGRVLMTQVGKHAAGRDLDGRTWDEFPQAVPA